MEMRHHCLIFAAGDTHMFLIIDEVVTVIVSFVIICKFTPQTRMHCYRLHFRLFLVLESHVEILQVTGSQATNQKSRSLSMSTRKHPDVLSKALWLRDISLTESRA